MASVSVDISQNSSPVQQAKKHRDEEIAPGADKTPQPGKKTHMEHHASDTAKTADEAAPVPSEEKPLY